MKARTYYTSTPPAIRLEQAGDTAILTATENAVSVVTEAATQYVCDEYRITLPYVPGLAERITANPASWLQKAKAASYAEAAAAIRAKRDKLLAASDKDMALDRLGLATPEGSTFTAWLSFFRNLGAALSGAKASYRQALRDIPEQEGFPYEVTWPEIVKKAL